MRIRLNSLVVQVVPGRGRGRHASVVYTPTGGHSWSATGYRVRARHVIMACWNRVTAQIVEDLPREQVKGLCYARKVPLIYGRAVLRNWNAWAQAKVSSISPRGNSLFWDSTSIAAGTSFGSVYGPTPVDPALPAVLNFTVVPSGPDRTPQLAAYEVGRQKLLSMSFRDLERSLWDVIDRTLTRSAATSSPGGTWRRSCSTAGTTGTRTSSRRCGTRRHTGPTPGTRT